MSQLPNCPQCQSTFTYQDAGMYICPECAHEWSMDAQPSTVEAEKVVRDANGNVLQDGDTITVIKDLKVKGSSSVVKVGTKVKNIRLVEGDHDIDCKIDGFGAMKLKSEFVKKAWCQPRCNLCRISTDSAVAEYSAKLSLINIE